MDVQSPAGQPDGTPAGKGTDGQTSDAAAGSPEGQPAGAPTGQTAVGRPPGSGHAGTRHFRIWRGSAAGGGVEDFRVEVNEGEVVLDVIHRLQATQAGDLAVRWNCKAGKCGSCSAEINGMPRLLCMTRMGTFAQDETRSEEHTSELQSLRHLVCR